MRKESFYVLYLMVGVGCLSQLAACDNDSGGGASADAGADADSGSHWIPVDSSMDPPDSVDTGVSVPPDPICMDCPSEDGLIAYYSFSGNADDASEHDSPDGDVQGAELTKNRFGTNDSAYAFVEEASSGDMIQLAENTRLPDAAEPRTVSVWINKPQTNKDGASIYSTILNWGLPEVEGKRFGVSTIYDSDLEKEVAFFTAESIDLKGSTPVSENGWHHIVVTYGENLAVVYLDNEPEAAGVLAEIDTDGQELRIGAKLPSATKEYFTGDIDDIRIYNRVLSRDEISDLFHEHGWATN